VGYRRAVVDKTDIALSPEAADLIAQLRPRIVARLEEVRRVPVSVLLWGPAVGSIASLASVRSGLRGKLRELGHAAMYSEELCDMNSPYPIRLQELAQAQEFDLVVSMPASPGSIGELHDFAADRRVHAKILAFLNQQHIDGYSPQSITTLATVVSCQIFYYPSETETSIITETTLDVVQRIREMKYITAGRYP
jgi:hypothetical protein